MPLASATGVIPSAEDQAAHRRQRLEQRLRNAIERLHLAERGLVQAIVAAHAAGLSLSVIASAGGLSRSRVHQLLQQNVGSAA